MLTMIVYQLQPPGANASRFSWMRILRLMAYRSREARLGQAAGSLTFTTTIALVPLLTVALAVFTVFPQFGQFQSVLQHWLIDNLMPESISRQVLGYLTQFTSKASRLGVVGIAGLLISAVTLIFTVDRSINSIWRVRRRRPLGQRVLIYWAAMTLGPVVMGLGVLSMSYLVSASGGWVGSALADIQFLLDGFEGLMLTALLAALYKYLPNLAVSWRHALTGSILATMATEAARQLLAHYLSAMPTYSRIYGAFATVPIFLIWIYTLWIIFLFGAVVVSILPIVFQTGLRQASGPGWPFQLAIEVLQHLENSRHNARRGYSIKDLVIGLNADQVDLEPVIETLKNMDWIGTLEEEDRRMPRLIMLVDPGQTPLLPLMERMLLTPDDRLQFLWAKWEGLTLKDAGI
jgi:membrane protein